MSLDFDIDNADGYDRIPSLPMGVFDVEISTLEHFPTGVDKDGNTIPGKKKGQAVSAKFEVLKVITQTKTPDDAPMREKETGENPCPSLVQVGETRAWFCNVEHEQNRMRLRHLVQAALEFEPDSPEATAAKDAQGQPVVWGKELAEAVGEGNPLAGQKLRVAIARVVTQKGKGFPMYVPSFSLIPK